MKTLHSIIYLSLSGFLLFSCSANKSPEERLVEAKKELTDLKSEIQKLESTLGVKNTEEKVTKVVETKDLAKGIFSHFIEVQGNVISDKNVVVNPEYNGIITQVLVEEGQTVKAGQVLASIDGSIILKNIEEVETRLQLANDLYNRQKNLWDQKIGSEVQFLQAKTNKEALENTIATLRSQLSKTQVKAPISGVVDKVFSHIGEMASPMVPVARIVNLTEVKVRAEVSENYVAKVHKGDQVQVAFPVLNKELDSRIQYCSQFIEADNRTFEILMEFSNADESLKPNIVAVVKIKDYENASAVTVPSNVIQQSTDGRKFIFIASKNGDKGTVQKKYVTSGISYMGVTEILEGLDGTEAIITKGYNDVVDGEHVILSSMSTQEKTSK